MARIYVGIGGWNFPAWRGRFYPPGLPHAQELAYASQRLTSIEINGTFYRHQAPASFAAWAKAVPDGFVFAVKAHRATTHSKDPARAAEAVQQFLASRLTELGDRLGPILWQFPPYRAFAPDALAAFLDLLPPAQNGIALRHVVEARHPSFISPDAVAQFRKAGVALAIIDGDKQALRGDVTADFVYARLQRNDTAAPEGYGSSALDEWATRANAWAAGMKAQNLDLSAPAPRPKAPARDVFLYFISGDKIRAPDAAMAFLQRIETARK
jgi:uncharacterized protein YecE (DUF72 family)